MSYLCLDCSKFFRNWGRLQQIGFRNDLNASRDVADIYVHAEEGCELCSIIRAYIPEEVKLLWSKTRYLQAFRLSVDLKGIEVGGAKLHVIKLELGVCLVEICVVPVLCKLFRKSTMQAIGLIMCRSAIDNQDQRGLASERFRTLPWPSAFMDCRMHQRPQMPGHVDRSFSKTLRSDSTCLCSTFE
jgi:hypothetical protein